jgi:hypothetical protein
MMVLAAYLLGWTPLLVWLAGAWLIWRYGRQSNES